MGDRDIGDESDADLIRRSLIDPDAFSAIFERHAGSVHRYLVKRAGQPSAEDLVGETFVAAFRSRANFDFNRSDARPWLFGIATNVTRHHWRSDRRRSARDRRVSAQLSESPDLTEDVESAIWFESQSTSIVWALQQIEAIYLDVLLLVAGPGFTYEEVAEALDIPIGTVRSRLARARRQLKELLGESGQYLDEVLQRTPPRVPQEGTP